ncbi:MAG: DNA cytosine methyltransferase [Terricaulis sp.]
MAKKKVVAAAGAKGGAKKKGVAAKRPVTRKPKKARTAKATPVRELTAKPRTSPAQPRPKSPSRSAGPTALTVVDLFAGAGGLSEGFRQAGFSVLAGSDNDPDAMATYAKNFGEAETITGDVRSAKIRARILEHACTASVIVGGPPCQAFSQVRNHTRLIDDERNSLYREFVHVLGKALPAAFIMENVTGIDQMGAREQIAADLALNGEYTILPQVVDAADFGVPQTRKRLLFVGVKRSAKIDPPRFRGSGATNAVSLQRHVSPKGSKYRVHADKDLLGGFAQQALSSSDDTSVVSAADAISDLRWLAAGNRDDVLAYPEVPGARSAYQRAMREGAFGDITNVQVPRIRSDTVLRLKGIPPGGNFRDLDEELLERYISGERWGQDNGSGKLSRQHFYAYRRLHPDIWAWTLNTKADSVYHYAEPRALSVREFARLQSFPDRFIFTTDPRKGSIEGRHDGGAAHSRYRQVGNAVPPLLANAVAQALTKQFASRSEPTRRSNAS